MTHPFPQLDAEQQGATSLLARWNAQLQPSEKRRIAEEACRILNQISQVREELIYPWCVGEVPPSQLDALVIEGDLIRVLVAEVMASDPTDLLYDGMMLTLREAVHRRWREEESAEGLWIRIIGKPFVRDLDVRLGQRLRELDQASLGGAWTPLAPVGLETLRDSVWPGSVRKRPR